MLEDYPHVHRARGLSPVKADKPWYSYYVVAVSVNNG